MVEMEKVWYTTFRTYPDDEKDLLRIGDNVTIEKFILFHTETMIAAENLGVTARWILLWLLQTWKERRFPNVFHMTDKQFSKLTGIRSRNTLLAARKKLQKAGLIKYTPSYAQGGTGYHIVTTRLTGRKEEEA